MAASRFRKGDRIAFSAAFLENEGPLLRFDDFKGVRGGLTTSERANWRGTYLGHDPAWSDMVVVEWDGLGHLSHVNTANIILASDIHLDAQRWEHSPLRSPPAARGL